MSFSVVFFNHFFYLLLMAFSVFGVCWFHKHILVRGIYVFKIIKPVLYNQGRVMTINGYVNLGLKNTLQKKFTFCLMAFRCWDCTFFSKLVKKKIGGEEAIFFFLSRGLKKYSKNLLGIRKVIGWKLKMLKGKNLWKTWHFNDLKRQINGEKFTQFLLL